MGKASWRRNAPALALSVAAHVVVLTAFALHTTRIVPPREDAGPPEPIIPILIMPHTPPAPPGATSKPAPIRLHRRRLHRELPPEVAPLVAPKLEALPAPAPTRPSGAPRATVQPSPASQLSTALRRSAVGCAHPALLNPDERAACEARLGKGSREAPYLPPAMEPDKQDRLEAAAAAADRAVRQKEAPPTAAVPDRDAGAGASTRNKPLYIPNLPPLRP